MSSKAIRPCLPARQRKISSYKHWLAQTARGLHAVRAQAGPLKKAERQIKDIALQDIRRPLGRTRKNDPDKVKLLAESIQEIGLQEPIDVLEVDGKIYGFSGCHRYEAHQQLGAETIKCRVRKASQQTLKMHLM